MSKHRGCITHKIFSNNMDFHILAFAIIDDDSKGRTAAVFKDILTCNLPTIGTGEWIEIDGLVTKHHSYGAQLIVDRWKCVACDKIVPKKPLRAKAAESGTSEPKVQSEMFDTAPDTVYIPEYNEDFGSPPSHFSDIPFVGESGDVFASLMNSVPDD